MKVINLEKDIGIKVINKFYTQLKDELSNDSEITLDFSNVDRIDLSLAQVILAARGYSKQAGKTIALKSVSKGVKNSLKLSGLMK